MCIVHLLQSFTFLKAAFLQQRVESANSHIKQ
jgi:hypothetical protein